MTEQEQAVRLYLDPAAHRKLRVAAAQEGLSMSAYVRQLVERAIGVGAPPAVEPARPARKKGKGGEA